jgi:branched-chain amino acid transport system permease protein
MLVALYARDHLYQVLATVGLILFFNELTRLIWGSSALYMRAPEGLDGAINLLGLLYPAYRLLVIVVGLTVAALLYALIHHTRIGMLARAGATNLRMVSVLGVDIKFLNSALFGAVRCSGRSGRIDGGPDSRRAARHGRQHHHYGSGRDMLIYLFMAIVLAVRPQGLFPVAR